MAGLLDVIAGANPVSAAVGGVVSIIGRVLDKIIPDPAAKAAAALELAKLQQSGELAQLAAETQLAQGQLDVNKVEAQGDWFRAGWRPFIGWVCGMGFAVQFLVGPLATWVAALAGHPLVFPSLDLSTLGTMLFGMLGLGAYRSYDKLQGGK